jgi:gamma-glutamyltranspeptidase/glutathione hydrolase|tara:strand:+ start:10810 stop:12471 length:1662 start_codon:yes stop_codon:yes gene_type:complete
VLKSIMLVFVLLLTSHAVAIAKSAETQTQAAVVTAHPLASQVGKEIIAAGGNAFDAAVAVSLALAVVEPYGSGLGGGGFWMLHSAAEGEDVMVDGREVAPLAAHPNLYRNNDGSISKDSVNGPRAAGIPGMLAALELISQRYGQLPWQQLVQPAVALAEEGFVPHARYQKYLAMRQAVFNAEARRIFAAAPLQAKQKIKQQDLAATLRRIASLGAVDFYQGETAKRMVAAVRAAGGIWQLDDLKQYKVLIRKPQLTKYKDLTLVLPVLPTSGGLVMSQILAMLEAETLPLKYDAESIHLLVEAMRRAYRDRAVYMGDPAFTQVPVEKLLSADYAKAKFADFNPEQASLSSDLEYAAEVKGEDTTHFSILDQQGNYVAATLSINYPFGSGFVAQGTGILLNDEMDDFALAPKQANVWGLVGGVANEIQPGKRMLSSMTPLFIRDQERLLILGTPGGSRIISMLTLAALRFSQGLSVDEIVAGRRFHHQYLPDEIQFELDALSAEEQNKLTAKGHKLKQLNRSYGDMHAIEWQLSSGKIKAAADPRGYGSALVFD